MSFKSAKDHFIRGITLFEESKYELAEKEFLASLHIIPNRVSTLTNLSSVQICLGKLDDARQVLERAISIDFEDSEAHFNLGQIEKLSSRYSAALCFFDKAISIDSKYVAAFIEKARCLYELEDFQGALATCIDAIGLDDLSFDAWFERGIVEFALHNYEDALCAFDRGVILRPDNPSIWENRGVCLSKLEMFHQAFDSFQKALNLNPQDFSILSNMGRCLIDLKRYPEALSVYDDLIVRGFVNPEILTNRGVILGKLLQLHESLDSFNQALRFDDEYYEALLNKGICLSRLNHLDSALVAFDSAIKIKGDVQIYYNKAVLLNKLKRYNDSLAFYKTAFESNPYIDYMYGNFLLVKLIISDWFNYKYYLSEFNRLIISSPLISLPWAALVLIDENLHSSAISNSWINSNLINLSLNFKNTSSTSSSSKIRVGYFSPDFRDHPVGLLMAELFESHNSDRFEVYGFSLSKYSDSPHRSRLIAAFMGFVELGDLSDPEAIELCRSYQLDIAVDLAGHTEGQRPNLFFNRVAPIQVNYLGYPGTFGHECMDYIIADRRVIPESQIEFYFEKVVSLPDTYLVDDRSRVPGDVVLSRADCGLPDFALVLCAFNNNVKINPTMFDAWAKILIAVPNSILWLSASNETFQMNIQREAQERGVDPNRLIFARRLPDMKEHLARYRHADIFLDTYPYNAHSTALDCLKSAVPIVTLRGQSFASRVAGSLMELLGVPELIAETHEEYAEKAIALATDSERLEQIKAKIQRNVEEGPLFDTQRFTRNLEAAYTQMVRRHRNGLKPDHFSIDGYEIV